MKKNRRVSKKRLTRRRKKKLKSRRRSLQAWLAWAAAEAQRQALAALVNGLKTLSNSGRTLVIEDGLNMSCSLNLDKMGRPSWEVSGGQEYPRYSRLQAHWLPPRIAGAEATLQRLGGWSLTMDYPVQRHASSLPPLPGGTAAPQATCLPPLKLTLIQAPDPQNIAPQRSTADCTLWKQPVAAVVVSTFSGAINHPPPLPTLEKPFPQKIGVDWTWLGPGYVGLYQGQLPGIFIIECNDPDAKQLPCNDKKGNSEHKLCRSKKYYEYEEATDLRNAPKRFRKTNGRIGKSYRPHKRLFSPKKMGNVKNRRYGCHKPKGYGPPAHHLSRTASQALLRELQSANSTGCSSDRFTLISPVPAHKGQLLFDSSKEKVHREAAFKKYHREIIKLRQTNQQAGCSKRQSKNYPYMKQLPGDDQKESSEHKFVIRTRIYYAKNIELNQATKRYLEQASGRPSTCNKRRRGLRKISYPIRKLSASIHAKQGKPWGATSSQGYPSPAAVKCDFRNRSQDPLHYCHNCISVKELSSWLSTRLLEAKQRVLNEGLGVLDGCFRGLSSIPTEYSYWPRLNREGRQKRAIWHKGLTELTVFGQQLQAMADSLAQEEARAVSLLNDYQELLQRVISALHPPQDPSTEMFSAKEALHVFSFLMPQIKQDILNNGHGVFEDYFLDFSQALATYEQPNLTQEEQAIKDILLEVFAELTAFDRQLQAFVASPTPEQGIGLCDSSARLPESDRLVQEMAADQEQVVGFHNRRERPRVTVTPSLPTPSQELGNPVNT